MQSEADIYEEGKNLVIELMIPKYLQEEEVEVNLTADNLKVIGKRNISKEVSSEDESYYAYEESAGAFSQEISIPVKVNPRAMKKEFEPGYLKIIVPKSG